MKIDAAHLRRFAPYLAPVVIVALGWVLLIRPLSAENARVASDLEGLRQRLNAVRAQSGVVLPPPQPVGDPMKAFEAQVATGDPTGHVLETLSRLAGAAGVQVETIEMVEETRVNPAGGPAIAGGVTPDPRFALFQSPLRYSPVTVTADTDYRSLGEFLWRLRDLPTLIEIRSLNIAAPPEPATEGVPAAGTLRMTMTLFAYVRSAAGAKDSR